MSQSPRSQAVLYVTSAWAARRKTAACESGSSRWRVKKGPATLTAGSQIASGIKPMDKLNGWPHWRLLETARSRIERVRKDQHESFMTQAKLVNSHTCSHHQYCNVHSGAIMHSVYVTVFPVLICLVTKPCPTLWPHGLQHARLLCPPLSPRVSSDSCPLSWWCYLTTSFSATFFSFPSIFPSIRVFF